MGAGAAAIAQKRAKEFQQRFNEKGATSPGTAKTLEELGLADKKSNTFYLMLAKKRIIKIGDRYYFDNERFDNRPVKRFKNGIAGLFKN